MPVTDLLERNAKLYGDETALYTDFVNGQVLYVDGGILAYIGKQP